jgi:hypothetical protein
MTADDAKAIVRPLLDGILRLMEPGEALEFESWLVREAHDDRDEGEVIAALSNEDRGGFYGMSGYNVHPSRDDQ